MCLNLLLQFTFKQVWITLYILALSNAPTRLHKILTKQSYQTKNEVEEESRLALV